MTAALSDKIAAARPEETRALSPAMRKALRHCTRDNPVLCGRPRTLRAMARMGLCWPPKDWDINRTVVLARPPALALAAALAGSVK